MGVFKGNYYAKSLGMTTSLNIIIPEPSCDVDPIIEGKPAVLFLLHGLGGNSDEWLRFSKIEYYAKKYHLFVIMPEVNRSFYSNTGFQMRYFDYLAEELPQFIETWFSLDLSRRNVFIAGESMGGYGALRIALSKPQHFAAAATLSGVLDIDDFHAILKEGIFSDISVQEFESLQTESLIPLAKALASSNEKPRIIQLCGQQDFLYQNNQNFKNALKAMSYGHTYMEAPGDHEWPYWDKAIQYAIRFFLRMDLNETILY